MGFTDFLRLEPGKFIQPCNAVAFLQLPIMSSNDEVYQWQGQKQEQTAKKPMILLVFSDTPNRGDTG